MQDLNKITLEARKAYRFLFQYQQRILDLMSFIGGSFNLKYAGGFSKFSNATPRDGRGKLENWAWDWLNMYFYEFHFQYNDNVKFSAFIVNDTGYYDSECAEESRKRLDVEDFEKVERSNTTLIFVAAKDMWGSPKEWGNWQSQEFLNTEHLVAKQEGGTGVMISKIYSLNSFATEQDAIDSLKDFSSYCCRYDIPIKYQERKL